MNLHLVEIAATVAPGDTPYSWSIRPAGTCRRDSSCHQTSPLWRCRRNVPSSIRSKTSGSSCVTTGCRTVSSNLTTISSTTAVWRETSSSISPGESCPSDCANGRRNLIKIWVAKYEAGSLDSDAAAADALADYEARIAAIERLVGKLALENEFLKGASRHVHQLRSASNRLRRPRWRNRQP